MQFFNTHLAKQLDGASRAGNLKTVLRNQRGASLIMVMMILTIVSLIGLAGVQISILSERSARNDRDQQLAWQSAEAALVDAEIDIAGASSLRRSIFSPKTNITKFVDGCGSTANGVDSVGLCSVPTSGKPAWASVDFTITGNAATTTEYGQYTNRYFDAGGVGVQPARRPRYVIEPIIDTGNTISGEVNYVYRVTAMGFGSRSDIQAVVQMLYRPKF